MHFLLPARRTLFQLAIVISVVAVAILGSKTGADAADQRIELGVAVELNEPFRLAAFEQAMGRQADVVRRFALWDEPFQTPKNEELLDGRKMILSIRPKVQGSPIAWRDIADAQPGQPLHDDMVAWAQSLAPYESQLWLNFHHEPEAGSNLPHGTATDYTDAWRTFMRIMGEQGMEPIGRVWIMTDYSFDVPAADRRAASKWYPGDEWVEAIAGDAYNWSDCRSNEHISWRELEQIIEGQRQFGADHPSEQLMLAEFGTVEDRADPLLKRTWFENARDLFATPGYEQFTVVSYFDLNHQEGNLACDWRVSTSSQSQDGFTSLASSSLFGGPDPDPDPAHTCTASLDPNGITLTWTPLGDLTRYNIRKNGEWNQTADNTLTTTDTTGTQHDTYLVRTHPPGTVIDTPCPLTQPA